MSFHGSSNRHAIIKEGAETKVVIDLSKLKNINSRYDIYFSHVPRSLTSSFYKPPILTKAEGQKIRIDLTHDYFMDKLMECFIKLDNFQFKPPLTHFGADLLPYEVLSNFFLRKALLNNSQEGLITANTIFTFMVAPLKTILHNYKITINSLKDKNKKEDVKFVYESTKYMAALIVFSFKKVLPHSYINFYLKALGIRKEYNNLTRIYGYVKNYEPIGVPPWLYKVQTGTLSNHSVHPILALDFWKLMFTIMEDDPLKWPKEVWTYYLFINRTAYPLYTSYKWPDFVNSIINSSFKVPTESDKLKFLREIGNKKGVCFKVISPYPLTSNEKKCIKKQARKKMKDLLTELEADYLYSSVSKHIGFAPLIEALLLAIYKPTASDKHNLLRYYKILTSFKRVV